jgi:hypothetical protein
MPALTPLGFGQLTPFGRLGLTQLVETFGESPDDYTARLQRRWAPARAPGAQLMG